MSCRTCHRDPARMNSDRAECSHVECPSRRRAWSERPRPVPAYARQARQPDTTAPLDIELAQLERGP